MMFLGTNYAGLPSCPPAALNEAHKFSRLSSDHAFLRFLLVWLFFCVVKLSVRVAGKFAAHRVSLKVF